MTPKMRENLLRYGDVLCLDMQARQFNSSGFPYCSPIGVSSEKQNAQTSEALVVEESMDSRLTDVCPAEPPERRTTHPLLFAMQPS